MGICAHAIIGLIKLLHPKKVCFPSRIRTKHFQIKKHFHWTIRDEADGWEYPWVPSPHDLWCTFLQKLKGTCQTALASRNTYCKRMSFFFGSRHSNLIWVASDSDVRHGKSCESFVKNGICAKDWLVLTRLSSSLFASSRSSASPLGLEVCWCLFLSFLHHGCNGIQIVVVRWYIGL